MIAVTILSITTLLFIVSTLIISYAFNTAEKERVKLKQELLSLLAINEFYKRITTNSTGYFKHSYIDAHFEVEASVFIPFRVRQIDMTGSKILVDFDFILYRFFCNFFFVVFGIHDFTKIISPIRETFLLNCRRSYISTILKILISFCILLAIIIDIIIFITYWIQCFIKFFFLIIRSSFFIKNCVTKKLLTFFFSFLRRDFNFRFLILE